VGWAFIKDPNQSLGPNNWLSLAIALVVGVLIVCLDYPRAAQEAGGVQRRVPGDSSSASRSRTRLSFVTALLVDQYIAADRRRKSR
jgi:hypothetical protein